MNVRISVLGIWEFAYLFRAPCLRGSFATWPHDLQCINTIGNLRSALPEEVQHSPPSLTAAGWRWAGKCGGKNEHRLEFWPKFLWIVKNRDDVVLFSCRCQFWKYGGTTGNFNSYELAHKQHVGFGPNLLREYQGWRTECNHSQFKRCEPEMTGNIQKAIWTTTIIL